MPNPSIRSLALPEILFSFSKTFSLLLSTQSFPSFLPSLRTNRRNMASKLASLFAKPSKHKKRLSWAYITLLAGNGDYVHGVVGLAKGLRKVESKYLLVVGVLPDVPEDHWKMLVDQGCNMKEIERVNPPKNLTEFAMTYYVINYSKLRIWKVCSVYKFVDYFRLYLIFIY